MSQRVQAQNTNVIKASSFALIWKRIEKPALFLLMVLIGTLIWFSPIPQGVSAQAWHLFAIFTATIFGVIARPLPMSAIAFLSLTFSIVSGVLSFEKAFSGFSNEVVWLIVMAFFIAKGFVITGLGNRIAYFFMKRFGKTTLGLGYGLILADFLLSPAIPSVTARSGGMLFPITQALAKVFGSEPGNDSSRKVGAFLTKVVFQGSVITSALFLTSMSGNPLIAQFAKEIGIHITWGGWAIASLVPGLCSLIIAPYILYKIYPPEIKETPGAPAYAIEKLKEMGSIKKSEWMMLLTFALLVGLWVFGAQLGIKAVIAALIGLSLLLLTGVLKWDNVLQEKGAWDALIWFSVLLTMASSLNQLGFTNWFRSLIVPHIQGMDWTIGFTILAIFYFYTHYFFAGNIAHIGAMYAPFLAIAVAIGTPPMLAALLLGFFSNLFGGITHYGSGPAPIWFGSGYVSIGAWWKFGGIISIVHVVIWTVVGGVWWKILGLW